MNTWGKLGISVAFVASFSMIMNALLRHNAFYEKHRWLICGFLAAVGLLLLVAGHLINRQIRTNRLTEDGEAPPDPFILVNMEYWGLMLVIFGVIVLFIAPLKRVEAGATQPTKKMAATTVTPKTDITEIKTVTFPKLRLQGIIVREPRPSALINGRTYFVGDLVEGVKVLSVEPNSVVVEFQGRQEALLLDK